MAQLIDIFLVAVPIALSVVVAVGVVELPVPWWLVAIAAALLLIMQTAAVTVRGRSLGRLVLRQRTVDDLTGTPVRPGRFLRQLRDGGQLRRFVTADLRRGRDPLDVRLSPPDLDATRPAASPPDPDRLPAHGVTAMTDIQPRSSVGIVLDSGERYDIHRALLLGRNPVDPSAGGERALLAWPDMSRRLAKTHLLLEWSGTVLWVTDLQTATGTTLLSRTGERQPVTPGVRTAAAIGTTIECGGRGLKVVPNG